jgi:hypothetical protein
MANRIATIIGWAGAVLLLTYAFPTAADWESSNNPHVRTDETGSCYSKSVPSGDYGTSGTTRIYWVTSGDDRLLVTYDWFSDQIYLYCGNPVSHDETGIIVVRLGPWPTGGEASADHLALAFYMDGRLLMQYSTLDLAGRPNNVWATVSHYKVVEQIVGFVGHDTGSLSFDIRTIDGRILSFDPATRALLGQ